MSTESQSPCFDTALHALVHDLLQNGADDIYAIVVDEAEGQMFQQVLAFAKGNISEASRLLGISRFTLRTKLNAYRQHRKACEILDAIGTPVDNQDVA